MSPCIGCYLSVSGPLKVPLPCSISHDPGIGRGCGTKLDASLTPKGKVAYLDHATDSWDLGQQVIGCSSFVRFCTVK